jgi:hypothetical protein
MHENQKDEESVESGRWSLDLSRKIPRMESCAPVCSRGAVTVNSESKTPRVKASHERGDVHQLSADK